MAPNSRFYVDPEGGLVDAPKPGFFSRALAGATQIAQTVSGVSGARRAKALVDASYGLPTVENPATPGPLIVPQSGIRGFFGASREISEAEQRRLARENPEQLRKFMMQDWSNRDRQGLNQRWAKNIERENEKGTLEWLGDNLLRGGQPSAEQILNKPVPPAGGQPLAPKAPPVSPQENTPANPIARAGLVRETLPGMENYPALRGAVDEFDIPEADKQRIVEGQTNLQEKITDLQERTPLQPGQMRAVLPDGTVMTLTGQAPEPGQLDSASPGFTGGPTRAQRMRAEGYNLEAMAQGGAARANPLAAYARLTGGVPLTSANDVRTATGQRGRNAQRSFMDSINTQREAQASRAASFANLQAERESMERRAEIEAGGSTAAATQTARGALSAQNQKSRTDMAIAVLNNQASTAEQRAKAEQEIEKIDNDTAIARSVNRHGVVDEKKYTAARTELRQQRAEEAYQRRLERMTPEEAQRIVSRVDAEKDEARRKTLAQDRAYLRAQEIVQAG